MATEDQITAYFASQDERRFASGVAIEERDGMVYLNFVQEEPRADRTSNYTGVVRLAITPALAAQLGERLSSLRSSEGG